MASVGLEAALNGPWGRARQPGAPILARDIVADGLAAAQAGAAILHLHAYDEETGRQRDDWELYARIFEPLRERCDALLYPTIPLAGSAYAGQERASRFAHVGELARRGLIDGLVVDPGSVDFLRFDQLDAPQEGFVYRNDPAEIAEGCGLAASYRLTPGFAIYEPGFTRLGAALAARAGAPAPIYRFMFSDEFAWGFPPAPEFLDAHRALLERAAPGAVWMVAGLGVDIRPLIGAAADKGGHVRVGLEDAPWGSPLTNRRWVDEARRLIEAGGHRLAAPSEMRARLEARPARV